MKDFWDCWCYLSLGLDHSLKQGHSKVCEAEVKGGLARGQIISIIFVNITWLLHNVDFKSI